MKRMLLVLLVAGFVLFPSLTAQAVLTEVYMDSFEDPDPLSNGWVIDRYAPNGVVGAAAEPFGGTYVQDLLGRPHYLLMGIHPDDSAANRPPGYGSTFYNTQGIKRDLSGEEISPEWWSAQIDVFLPPMSGPNTTFRTDFWGRNSNPSEVDALYPIIGYTNEGGTSRFRVWVGDIGWIDLDPIADGFDIEDGWNTLAIEATLNSFTYKINESIVYYDHNATNDFASLSGVYIEAYNYGQNPYIVAYDNLQIMTDLPYEQKPVPEPATASMALIAVLLIAACMGRASMRRMTA